jgi:anaerobic selenocysteine-containing dehydrogenase
VQRVRKAAVPPGIALPDWEILCRIARKMGKAGFEFGCASDVYKELSGLIDGMERFDALTRAPRALTGLGGVAATQAPHIQGHETDENYPFMLTATAAEHSHRGFPLSRWVEGSKLLLTDGVLEINPRDAQRAGISNGDYAVVESNTLRMEWPARVTPDQPERALRVALVDFELVNANPQPVKIRRKDV